MALSLFNNVPVRTRRLLSLYKAYGHSALLILNQQNIVEQPFCFTAVTFVCRVWEEMECKIAKDNLVSNYVMRGGGGGGILLHLYECVYNVCKCV